MSISNIKLPKQMSGAGLSTEYKSTEDPRVEVEKVKREAGREQGQLEIIKETIGLFGSFLDVVKSNQNLESKRVEWESRVAAAQSEVEKAQVELQKERELTTRHSGDLQTVRVTQQSLIAFFDQLMEEMSDPAVDTETRNASRKSLLALAEQMVKLKA
ncbi:hypothetical protein ACSBPU_06755 [Parapusillimonas sp. JC17]|uniref:hypothetical protein n=1 Tax=Parapusillimonas sp. JC17 TaxID=3445768 RepID=UPI003F9F89C7